MTMVGDMFNGAMRSKLDAVASKLSAYLASQPERRHSAEVSYTFRSSTSSSWWSEDLGTPHSTGSQNSVRYAIFEDRVAIDDHGTVTVYDTAGHDTSGIAQAQGSASTLTLTGRTGMVRVSDLKIENTVVARSWARMLTATRVKENGGCMTFSRAKAGFGAHPSTHGSQIFGRAEMIS
jgi:hypothetical protein